ncbi:hypothetical protein Ddc_10039 [Ditylenchus destructor]|nr:hypothetical protein Ddc_10039 [Ditylenchus destructor]
MPTISRPNMPPEHMHMATSAKNKSLIKNVRFFPNKPKDVNNKTLFGSRARIKKKNENRRLFSGQAKKDRKRVHIPKEWKARLRLQVELSHTLGFGLRTLTWGFI